MFRTLTNPLTYFEGTPLEWIEELTTYQFLYPYDWNQLYQEYCDYISRQSDEQISVLKYYRDDDGYLRRKDAKIVFLKIKIAEPTCEIVKEICEKTSFKHQYDCGKVCFFLLTVALEKKKIFCVTFKKS